METKWTKGPWKYGEKSLNRDGFVTSPILAQDRKIGSVFHIGYGDGSEESANAKLIAKAPEMAELLMESKESIGSDWRERRDKVLREAGAE